MGFFKKNILPKESGKWWNAVGIQAAQALFVWVLEARSAFLREWLLVETSSVCVETIRRYHVDAPRSLVLFHKNPGNRWNAVRILAASTCVFRDENTTARLRALKGRRKLSSIGIYNRLQASTQH
jgi:hypothetical protein